MLIDDLWALATSRLTELKTWDKWVGENACLKGRNLQPWRAVLAIAAWLENCGEEGLWLRIEQLSVDYQRERATFELSDLTMLVVRALIRCAVRAVSSISANIPEGHQFIFTTEEVTQTAIAIVKEDGWDFDVDFLTSRRVGRVVAALRFLEVSRPGGIGPRRRMATLRDIQRLAESYGIALPPQFLPETGTDNDAQPPVDHGSNGTNGSNGTERVSIQLLLEERAKSSFSPDISKPCYFCGETNWRTRPSHNGGGAYCGTCHPSPSHS